MSNTIVNTNVSAMNSHRQILSVGGRQARSSERLSSGMRINRAADDAAGLAISEGMRNQIKGLDQAVRNSQDGISLVQTAEGALEEVHRMGERMRQLTVQAANDTNRSSERANILLEIDQLTQDIARIASDTQFNGMNILGHGGSITTAAGGGIGGFTNTPDGRTSFNIQSGANSGQSITVNTTDLGAALEVLVNSINDTFTNGSSHGSISSTLDAFDDFIKTISDARAVMGAQQNRLDHTINSLSVTSENLSAANSRIRDTDMAAEMMALTQANVLQQAGMSMLAQANQAPQNILQLVG